MPRLYRYRHLDVFTNERFAGNQLAVFLDARGLSPAEMQAIAREMNFSESTFILPSEQPGTDVRMRIFTPGQELPMAGHPTIGSTFALADEGLIESGARQFVFGLGVGPTPVSLTWEEARLSFAWMTQLAPTFGPVVKDADAVAAALGIDAQDIRATGWPIQQVSCGVPFLVVPMATRRAVDATSADPSAIRRLMTTIGLDLPVFLFSAEPVEADVTAYSRMYAPGFGVLEDPATGSASGPLGCYLVQHGIVARDRADRIVSLQGVKMGRPSRIHVAIACEGERIASVQVGGEAVTVGHGDILV